MKKTNIDSPFYRTMGKIGDLLFANLLWLVCCLPIVTALDDPAKVIAEPAGFLIAPRDWERVGDVSNVVFTNGAIADEDGSVYIYYAASDTRLHVASTTIDKLLDFAFNTPADPLRSVDCVKQRCELIDKNLEYLKSIGE